MSSIIDRGNEINITKIDIERNAIFMQTMYMQFSLATEIAVIARYTYGSTVHFRVESRR